jgi:hypothetical protein
MRNSGGDKSINELFKLTTDRKDITPLDFGRCSLYNSFYIEDPLKLKLIKPDLKVLNKSSIMLSPLVFSYLNATLICGNPNFINSYVYLYDYKEHYYKDCSFHVLYKFNNKSDESLCKNSYFVRKTNVVDDIYIYTYDISSFSNTYNLFLKGDYGGFDPKIKEIIKRFWSLHSTTAIRPNFVCYTILKALYPNVFLLQFMARALEVDPKEITQGLSKPSKYQETFKICKLYNLVNYE